MAVAAAAIAWSFFAFGAVYAWAAPPLLLLSLTALTLARAWPHPRRLVDAAAVAALALAALQLVPLPPAFLAVLAPASAAFRNQMQLDASAAGWHPLTLDPALTGVALMLAGSAFALFLTVRETAAAHGRTLARWIAWIALVGACIGIGRSMLFPGGRIYGFWAPIERGAAPFGSIINRNHFAAWALVAIGIVAGAFIAQVTRRRERAAPARRLAAMLSDTRGAWLLFSVALLTASIILTASRAGFVGLLAASAGALALTRKRAGAMGLVLFAAIGIACVVAALSWARPDRLLTRLGGESGSGGTRSTIWRETAAIAARYPIAGVGLGAFPTAMTVYQEAPRRVFFNHAHNQYLELAAEGGLLMSLALLLFAAGVARTARAGLAMDAGSFFWLRAGAAAALAGIAVLSIWESPFRTPATLMIAAVAAGLAAAAPRR